MMPETAWKVWRHDHGSPLQKDTPIVWDGTTPWISPQVERNQSDDDCAEGWNACPKACDALRISGLWRNGRAAILTRVQPANGHTWVKPSGGDKWRTAQLQVLEIVDPSDAVLELSQAFGAHAQEMADAQMRFWRAFGSPGIDAAEVERGLQDALHYRGLSNWTLRKFDDARDAWDARVAWVAWDAWDARVARVAWVAWDAWDARVARVARVAMDARVARAARVARVAMDVRAARAAWVARAAWAAWAARFTRDAMDAWTAWAAWDASVALLWRYAALMGWVDDPADVYEIGALHAVSNGLALAIPTAPNELGYALRKDAD